MSRVKTSAVAAVIAAQVAVPLVASFDVPPTPFGFQMYSALGYVKVDAVDLHGDPVDIDVDGVTADILRPSLDWTEALPEHVCDRLPAAGQVTVEQREWSRTVQCN